MKTARFSPSLLDGSRRAYLTPNTFRLNKLRHLIPPIESYLPSAIGTWLQVPGDKSLSEKRMGDMNQPAKCVYQDKEGDLKSQRLRSIPWIFVNNIFYLWG